MRNTKLKPTARLDAGEHAATALHLISFFTWLRAPELGKLMYPRDEHARKYAEKHLRKLRALRYVVARPLPGKDAGKAYVLSQRGAAWLTENSADGQQYEAGTRWGESSDGTWTPPASWKHDLWATGVLALLREMGAEVLPELQLRKRQPMAEKHPDGVAITKKPNGEKQTIWLEVEQSRKQGKNLERMLRAVVKAARGQPMTLYPGLPPVTVGMIAIPSDARDERGYRVNHLARIEKKVAALGVKEPVTVLICTMHLRGVGVERIDIERKTFSHRV